MDFWLDKGLEKHLPNISNWDLLKIRLDGRYEGLKPLGNESIDAKRTFIFAQVRQGYNKYQLKKSLEYLSERLELYRFLYATKIPIPFGIYEYFCQNCFQQNN